MHGMDVGTRPRQLIDHNMLIRNAVRGICQATYESPPDDFIEYKSASGQDERRIRVRTTQQ